MNRVGKKCHFQLSGVRQRTENWDETHTEHLFTTITQLTFLKNETRPIHENHEN